MPDALEYLVRPYTTPDAHGRTINPSSPRGTREKARLTWGGGPVTPPARKEVSDGVNFKVVCCKENLKEQDRKNQRQRLFQNNDESSPNWVDIDHATSLRLKKKEQNKCGDDWDQISGVAQQVNSVLSGFDYALHSGTLSPSTQNCAVTWNFKPPE